MKRIISSLAISLFLVMAMLLTKPADAQPRMGVNISFQTFYDELSPYGDWIDYPDYGYSWRPRVGADFRPYSTNGYWMYTNDYDWMWNSGYDWGWAPFHYGRWFYDPYYGWMWVPGYDWSPAWVAWRGGGDYYGWAPIRPGFSINIGFGNYNCPYDYWTFAPGRYMTSRYISNYYHPYRNNVTIINNTTIINNYGGRDRGSRGGNYYINGPRRGDVERYTGRINPYNVRESRDAGRATVNRNSVSVYRPAVQRDENNTRYSPRDVQTYDRSVASRGDNLRARQGVDNAANTRGGNDVRNSDAGTRGRGNSNVTDNGRISGGRTNSDVNGRVTADRERMNTSPRQEDAIYNQGRGNRDAGIHNQDRVQRGQDNQRQVDVRQRNDQMREQRDVETRQRNDQMQQQRDQQNQQRIMESRQRAEQMQQQRSAEMRQRNDQMQQQREQQNQQRIMESRQRSEQMQQQRATEMRQRNEQMQQQRSVEMRQRQEQQVQQQRQMESRQRSVDMPQRQAPVQQRSMERSPSVSPDRGSAREGSMRRF